MPKDYFITKQILILEEMMLSLIVEYIAAGSTERATRLLKTLLQSYKVKLQGLEIKQRAIFDEEAYEEACEVDSPNSPDFEALRARIYNTKCEIL